VFYNSTNFSFAPFTANYGCKITTKIAYMQVFEQFFLHMSIIFRTFAADSRKQREKQKDNSNNYARQF
jgi:hypothetical protein